MKKKAIVVAASVVGAVVVLGLVFLFVLSPRITAYNAVKDKLANVIRPAAYVTDFSAKGKDTITVDNGSISFEIDSSYELDEEVGSKMSAKMYISGENGMFIMEPYDFGDSMNFLDEANYVGSSAEKLSYTAFVNGVKKIGHGTPDSAYESLKCMYLLENSDYSFWDIEKGMAYAILLEIRDAVVPENEYSYIYERDDIRGFVLISYPGDSDGQYGIRLDIFPTSDLDTVTSVVLRVNSLDEAYAIMNSAKSLS